MLVCSCNRIDHLSIEAEVDRQVSDDPTRAPSAPRIYLCLGERPRCGGCLPLAEKIITSRRRKIKAESAGVS